MRLFDSHAHFGDDLEQSEAEAILGRAAVAGVSAILVIGGDAAMNSQALAMAAGHTGQCAAAIGYDRGQAADRPDLPALEQLLADAGARGIRAVGETGLDYHYSPDNASDQRQLMRSQLEMAARAGLPSVVHSRNAEADTLRILEDHASTWRGDPAYLGVLHCFTGTREFARDLVAMGYHVSFSGIVTFRNADALRAVVPEVPADRLLIETDSPYLAPVPFRGKRNEPSMLVTVAETVASARGESVEDVAETCFRNAAKLFAFQSD